MLGPVEVAVIGAGQAGLATSYYLTRQGREHVVLEQSRIGESWSSQRWDPFTLVTPNWMLSLPGFAYDGPDPDGFLPRDGVVNYLERYAASFNAPVHTGVRVMNLDTRPDGGYVVRTDQGDIEARTVVVATGFFGQPKIPAAAEKLPADITQIHSSAYKNPAALPAGAALVVGSGQSGCQIAEELFDSGRTVYLSTGRAGRFPRRYRGKDTTWWADKLGMFSRTPDQLSSLSERFAGNPHCSGTRGGHTINLHQFARDGMVLLGHFRDVQDGKLTFAPTLKANLAQSDKMAADIRKGVDELIRKTGLEAAAPQSPDPDDYDGDDGYHQPEVNQLDPKAAGITSIVWANGFSIDYRWLNVPNLLEPTGYPLHRRGVTDSPGLYFTGLHFQHSAKSDLFYGVGEDAAHVASAIAEQLDRPASG